MARFQHGLSALIIGISIIASASASAATCPLQLHHDKQGYWESQQAPGWKSVKPTQLHVQIESKNFGGIVYSPKHHRLACVYRASNDEWIALVSKTVKSVKVDKKALDDSGKHPAWSWSKEHQDYACGHPSVARSSGCRFTLH